VFVPRRHDDTPVTLLGVDGVHDVDTVIDAVVDHPAHARFVAERVASEFLGDPELPALAGVVDELAGVYVDGELQLDPVIAAALRLGLDGASSPLVAAPVPWLIGAARATRVTGREFHRAVLSRVPGLGQIPLLPPSVAGWPRGAEWFTASSLIARTNVAASIAAAVGRDEPLRVAADDADLDRLGEHLGLADGFLPSTAATLRAVDDPVDRLTLALVCPEYLAT
jgi:uncharacterized protein (DUF1800 family)